MENEAHQTTTPPPLEPTKTAAHHEEKQSSIQDTIQMSQSRYPRPQGILVFTVIFLILSGITILTLYFIYHPKPPSFTIIGAAVYALTLTPSPLSSVSASIQFNIVTENPNKRVSIFYDRLTASVSYHDQPITPPLELPSFLHETRSTVAMSPVIGGGTAVPVTAETLDGLRSDLVGYGAVELGVVVMGKLRWKMGLFTTGRKSVRVFCDVAVSLKNGSSGGQVPLLPYPNTCHFHV